MTATTPSKAGPGFNIIFAGNGDNLLLGGPDGNLFLTNEGEVGDNLALGGTGRDIFSAGEPFDEGDRFEGGGGNDGINGILDGGIFLGGPGDNYVQRWLSGAFDPGSGKDSVQSLEGPTFYGGDGNDCVTNLIAGTFYGGAGDDRVGQLRAGTFYGEAGNDQVSTITGGVFLGGEGNEIVSSAKAQGSTAAAPATTVPLSWARSTPSRVYPARNGGGVLWRGGERPGGVVLAWRHLPPRRPPTLLPTSRRRSRHELSNAWKRAAVGAALFILVAILGLSPFMFRWARRSPGAAPTSP